MSPENKLIPLDFGVSADASKEELRLKIEALEYAMFNMPDRHIEIEPVHRFAHGLYAREIIIPKGTTLTGEIHKFSHINVISKGDISVLTENGIERLQAPATIVSQPGTKRVGYAHEDTIWTTFHATTETDINKIEAELVEVSRYKRKELAEILGVEECRS